MRADQRKEAIAESAAALFAERGYRAASVDEIAARAGVTPPVVYDHFASKRELYGELLESHFADLRTLWSENLAGVGAPEDLIARSIDAWFAYVEQHPFASRVLFRANDDPDIASLHAAVAERSKQAMLPLLAAGPGTGKLASSLPGEGLEMAWVVVRGALQGLAVWWADHPATPRDHIVAAAMSSLWIGLERVQRGDFWEP